MKIGYVRVSKQEQHEALQIDALKVAGCEKWFLDKMTGSKAERKGLDEALAYLRPGDTLVVWKLDRAGRSLTHLIDLLKGLNERGIGFMSLTEQIDTTTPGGKLIFHLMGALAEFERDLIRERTNAGLAAAKARGRVGGRPRARLSAYSDRRSSPRDKPRSVRAGRLPSFSGFHCQVRPFCTIVQNGQKSLVRFLRRLS